MLNREMKTTSEAITADGGIVKMPIREGKKGKPINWIRGANAKFYYTAHAYAPTEDTEHSSCKDHDHHNHKHDDKCGKEDKEALADKVNFIQTLLDPVKQKEFFKDKEDKEFIPKGKPVRTLVSDSRKNEDKPFELRIGYSFSVQAMEICIKTMKIGEKSRFLCMPEYCQGFVQLETVMRQEKLNTALRLQGKPTVNMSGCCAHATPEMLELSKGLDLAQGMPLEFEFELIEVMMPDSFVQEPWEMETSARYLEIPKAKFEGGELYKNKDWKAALDKYERCIALIESLNNSGVTLDLKKERMDKLKGKIDKSVIPDDNIIVLEVLENLDMVCRLNYAACKLKLGDFNSVIIQCSHVLKSDARNVKALFRRGQAYFEIGRDLDLAEKDFDQIESIIVDEAQKKELAMQRARLAVKLNAHAKKEREMFGGKLFQ